MSKDKDRIDQLENEIQELKNELTKLKNGSVMNGEDKKIMTITEEAEQYLCDRYGVTPKDITSEWLKKIRSEDPAVIVLSPRKKKNQEFERSILEGLQNRRTNGRLDRDKLDRKSLLRKLKEIF